MKRFVRNSILFALPILLLAYPLDNALSDLLKESFLTRGEMEVWNDIYDGKAACDLAVYGSSRAWVHIDPAILKDSLGLNTYNFGLDGHNFWLQYLRHLELLEHNPAPKKIILSVDVFTLDKREDLFSYEQFMPYMLGNERIKEYTNSFVGFSTLDYYLPLVRYAGEGDALTAIRLELFAPMPEVRVRTKGFRGVDRVWNTDLEKAKAQQDYLVAKIDPPTLALFERFVEECKQASIKLDLVYTPEYIEAQQFVSNRQMVLDQFRQLADKHGLRILDYSKDSISMDRSLFYNGQHLNKNGAELFSRKLAHDLKPNQDN